jgi:uncharacterized membrane protein YebE (DUF533 family)
MLDGEGSAMNTSDLLEQLLRASQGAAAQQQSQNSAGGLGGLLGGLLGGGAAGGLGGLLGGSNSGGLGALGALLGGLLGVGNSAAPAGRSGGTNYAMLASLGMMAFQAYQSWQRLHPNSAPAQSLMTVDQLDGPAVDAHSHAILRALIAAAKADGRIDEREQAAIQAEIACHAGEPDLQAWIKAEVSKPLNAAEVAQAATSPAMAAEMYLVSVMLVDGREEAERIYLDEFAYHLKLAPELQAHLEQQAKAGGEVA